MNFQDYWQKVQNVLDNKYVTTALSIFFVMYGSMVAPKLPAGVAGLFKNPLVQILIFFLIAYTSVKNPTIAIIIAVGFLVSLQTLNKHESKFEIIDEILGTQLFNVPLEQPLEEQVLEQVPDQEKKETVEMEVEEEMTESQKKAKNMMKQELHLMGHDFDPKWQKEKKLMRDIKQRLGMVTDVDHNIDKKKQRFCQLQGYAKGNIGAKI